MWNELIKFKLIGLKIHTCSFKSNIFQHLLPPGGIHVFLDCSIYLILMKFNFIEKKLKKKKEVII